MWRAWNDRCCDLAGMGQRRQRGVVTRARGGAEGVESPVSAVAHCRNPSAAAAPQLQHPSALGTCLEISALCLLPYLRYTHEHAPILQEQKLPGCVGVFRCAVESDLNRATMPQELDLAIRCCNLSAHQVACVSCKEAVLSTAGDRACRLYREESVYRFVGYGIRRSRHTSHR